MKKILLIAAMFLSFGTMMAQEQKEEMKGEVKQDPIALAAQLSRYGYANQSPMALVQAAQIVLDNGIQQRAIEGRQGTAHQAVAADKKSGHISLDAAQLLKDARELAGKDKTMLSVIQRVEENQAQRGRVNAPYYDTDICRANSSVTYRLNFRGGELARAVCSGDGDTDLDMYVYDENDNFITKDDDYTDDCVCTWNPKWTGIFRIVIRNRGNVYNEYVFATN